MSARMKKHPTNKNIYIRMQHAGKLYQFPMKIAEKYCVSSDVLDPDQIFSGINKKHTKPAALLRGIRTREGLTQIQMAEKIQVTQSDISQMESGTRRIGRNIAQRIEALFDIDYHLFLS